MLKRTKLILLVLLVIFQTGLSDIKNVSAEGINTVDDSIKIANDFMKENFKRNNYFEKTSLAGKPIYSDLAIKGNSAFSNKPIFVYQTEAQGAEEASKYGNDTRRYDSNNNPRALGFSFTDSPYANPRFHIDNVTYVRRWIKEPWVLPKGSQGGITKTLSPDNPNDTHDSQWLEYQPNEFASTYSVIKQWLKSDYFLPNSIQERTGNQKFFNKNIEGELPAGIKNNPEDYIYIIQPPTFESWGIGIAFYYYGGTGDDNMSKANYYSYYQYFRFKPFSLLTKDLSANFDSLPSSVAEGEDALVTVNVQSTFKEDLKDIPFEWKITKKDGTPLEADSGLKFLGDANVQSGKLNIPVSKKEAVLYASFKMPDSDVNIEFKINKDGKNPVEKLLDNNIIDSGEAIKVARDIPPGPPEKFDLDYNVLSRKVTFPLASGNITASLSLPRGSWNGNATGSLDVSNGAADLFRDFSVTNNPYVNEASSTIVRNPQIYTTFKREDFGDDPLHKEYAKGPGSKTRTGNITFGGSVSRPYVYTYYDGCGNMEDSDGDTYCGGHTGYGSTSAAFNSGTNTSAVKTYIYNGKKSISPKDYTDDIEDNSEDSHEKKLYWTSEPYQFNVIRWMCHQDEDSSLYGWTPVPGQYERTFTQQCSGDVRWSTESSMAHEYKNSREAAKSRYHRKSQYDKAVFASDVDFRNVDYPIKSGYYFNPTGTYTFTVKTVTYKPTTDDTKDHWDLVNSVINSFRYETDLMYINNNKQIVNLQNQPLSPSGNSYRKLPGTLTAQDTTGVNGIQLLNVLDRNDNASRYSKTVEEIEHTQDSGDEAGTHRFWKNILEGYSESGTIDSKNKYKYKEYVRDGEHIYRITEETKVTIQVNPGNVNLYTYAHMPNGKYTVRAWIGDFTLPYNEYHKLGTLRGISSLDNIEVSVKGSMYDDIY